MHGRTFGISILVNVVVVVVLLVAVLRFTLDSGKSAAVDCSTRETAAAMASISRGLVAVAHGDDAALARQAEKLERDAARLEHLAEVCS